MLHLFPVGAECVQRQCVSGSVTTVGATGQWDLYEEMRAFG